MLGMDQHPRAQSMMLFPSTNSPRPRTALLAVLLVASMLFLASGSLAHGHATGESAPCVVCFHGSPLGSSGQAPELPKAPIVPAGEVTARPAVLPDDLSAAPGHPRAPPMGTLLLSH